MITLDIAIATHKPEGIRRLAQAELPVIDGVRYVVSWQSHQDAEIPAALLRDDVEIHRFDGHGQSRNRNNSVEHCRADVVMTSDDDLIFFPEGIRALMEAYEAHPEVDFISFRSIHKSGVRYPAEPSRLHRILPKGYYVACFELSFRRGCGLRFCTELGLNSPRMHGGEDEILLQSAIRRGLNCWFWPITVCEHDHPSTGTKARFSNENLRASGAVIALTFGWQALLRVPLKAWRVARAGQASLPRALFYIAQGAVESRRIKTLR